MDPGVDAVTDDDLQGAERWCVGEVICGCGGDVGDVISG